MKQQISATIVAHSENMFGDELITVLATFPRMILAEVNTHRMLSKNTSSSRAIPFRKMAASIESDPFIPIAWQKEHSGMQGAEYFTSDNEIAFNKYLWIEGRDRALASASLLNEARVTKQLSNRLLEPFMWTTMLITGPKSGWDNFFSLRCPLYQIGTSKADVGSVTRFKSKKDAIKEYPSTKNRDILFWLGVNKSYAEIHISTLAECIWDAVNESTPEKLGYGMWHIPFKSSIDQTKLLSRTEYGKEVEMVKISTAMAARTSYTVVGEEKEVDYVHMVGLYERLITQDPPHSSPMEHCAITMQAEDYPLFIRGQLQYGKARTQPTRVPYAAPADRGWCRNLKGFIPLRHLIESGDKV